MAAQDLSQTTPSDLARLRDLEAPAELGASPDLASLPDLSTAPDLTSPMDLEPAPDLARGPTCCGSGCVDCRADDAGHACVAGACGCTGASDCPSGSACDSGTHTCSTSCGGGGQSACNDGCCSNSGLCVLGTANGACGHDGTACSVCGAGTPTCSAITSGGTCTADCGNPGNGSCSGGFCCSSANLCVSGTSGSACGNSGACIDCTTKPGAAGLGCVGGQCGCSAATECPSQKACNTDNNTCETSCSAGHHTACNGGCCVANLQCVAGNQFPNACGNDGGSCGRCGIEADNCAAGSCACGMGAPCAAGLECVSGNCTCTASSCGSCCNGNVCAASSFPTCGTGVSCAACDTMVADGCTADGACQCGSSGATCDAGQQCVDGNCQCNATACTSGCCVSNVCTERVATACGPSCVDCTQSSSAGRLCFGNGNCGCIVATDCPSGYSCNTVTNVCETACGDGSHTACNAGCCNGGTCGADNASLTGYVFDPGNHLPIYDALVYVPYGTVQVPLTGVDPNNPQCGCSPPPTLASATTDISGKFTMTGVPSGDVDVVVQIGKWQRKFSSLAIASCTANDLGGGTAGSSANLTLPATHSQGNIPLFAVDTGADDSLECLLLMMGVAQGEFVNPAISNGRPTSAGRVHLYRGSIVEGGAIIDGNTPTEDALTETASVMNSYDALWFPCQGAAGTYDSASGWPNTLQNLVDYVNAGGVAMMMHSHYDLLDGNGALSNSANWISEAGSWGLNYSDPQYNSNINSAFTLGSTLASWLHQTIVYGGTLDQIPIGVIRNDFSSVNSPALLWASTANGDENVGGTSAGPGPGVPLLYSFSTPFNTAQRCGEVVYGDFHAQSFPSSGGFDGVTFPSECPTGGLQAQAKALEFLLFQLNPCNAP